MGDTTAVSPLSDSPLSDSVRTTGAIPPGFGLPLAVVTGLCYAAAANLASYMATEAERTGVSPSRHHTLLVDFLALAGYIVGGGIITVAYASGDPVPVVNAVMVATNLTANMIMQMGLGITFYSKDMRTGTCIFVVAVFQLAQLGPASRGETDLFKTFRQPWAIGCLAGIAFLCAVSALGIMTTLKSSSENLLKIVSWSLLISCLGSLTDNGASMFGLLKDWVLVVAMGFYGVVAFTLLLLSSKAPAVCEAAIYVPMQLCTQMVLNMITGFYVWEDQLRLKHMGAYLATFAICLMSVYIASDNVDIMASGRVKLVKFRGNIDHTHFGRSVLEVLACWQQMEVDPSEEAAENSALALRTMLEKGLERGVFNESTLAELVVSLNGEVTGFRASAHVVRWMEKQRFFKKYEAWNPDFKKAIRSALPAEEMAKFQVMLDEETSQSDERSSEEDIERYAPLKQS